MHGGSSKGHGLYHYKWALEYLEMGTRPLRPGLYNNSELGNAKLRVGLHLNKSCLLCSHAPWLHCSTATRTHSRCITHKIGKAWRSSQDKCGGQVKTSNVEIKSRHLAAVLIRSSQSDSQKIGGRSA